ncbi:MAG: hypothetical protein NC417_05680 [Candidatus Gastranaerophilales bacterium]|nr:hypothetical protein [Candidatus Gastranaerophilales bacterium]
MREKDIIGELKNAAKVPIPCDEERKEAFLVRIRERSVPVRKRGSFGAFVWSQIYFMDRMVLFWQGLWLLLFFLLTGQGESSLLTDKILCILSMAPPLLLLLTVEEVSRVYNKSMLEIEYATKYSLKKAVMVRMLLLSLLNGVFLAVGILYAKGRIGLTLSEALAYGLTPLLLMTCLLLMFMQRWRGDKLKYAGISVYVLISVFVLVGQSGRWNIYSEDLLGIWLSVLAVSAVAVVYEWRRLMRRLEYLGWMME